MAELVSSTYSHALFEVAQEKNKLDDMLSEIKFVSETLIEFPNFYEILKTPQINSSEKKNITTKIFEGKISKETLNFLKIIIDKRREKQICDIADHFELLYCQHEGIVKGIAFTSMSMSEEQKKSLELKLSKKTGKNVTLENQIDKSLLGGVMIKFGDRVIDGSLKGKLKELEDSLNKIIV